MAEDRVAILLRLRPKLKEQLVDLAKREHRSINQQVEFILEDFLSHSVGPALNEHSSETRSRGKGGVPRK